MHSIATSLALVMGIAAGAEHAPDARRRAIAGVLDAFSRTPLVALEIEMDRRQDHEFLRALVAEPRFAEVVDDVVVEFGNARHQDVMDRYVAGGEVDLAEVQAALRDTTQWCAWDSPAYAAFLEQLRTRNAGRAPDEQVRVVLADPPIDWAGIHAAADLDAYAGRDAWIGHQLSLPTKSYARAGRTPPEMSFPRACGAGTPSGRTLINSLPAPLSPTNTALERQGPSYFQSSQVSCQRDRLLSRHTFVPSGSSR